LPVPVDERQPLRERELPTSRSISGHIMKIDIRPNLDQIRAIAKSAMHAWDFQDLEAGRDQVIADMQALLEYLSAFDHAEGVVVASVYGIEPGIRIERSTRPGDFFDLAHRYISQNTSLQIHDRNGRRCGPEMGEQRVRVDDHTQIVDRNDDLGAGADGVAKR